MSDDTGAPGSLLDAAFDSLERHRLRRLWNGSNARTVSCRGCGTSIRTPGYGSARRWCDLCLPIATDMSLVRSAAKKFVQYGLTDAAAAAAKALEDLRGVMRANGRAP
ncbi:MAG: hypothetical protein M3O91_04090 [Chloroflexota bacterium]|nr:hypothetical protein [Chloroflexota bacterium]